MSTMTNLLHHNLGKNIVIDQRCATLSKVDFDSIAILDHGSSIQSRFQFYP